jgi:hypothetical protein
MKTFDKLFNNITEQYKDIKFKSPRDLGAENSTSGISADTHDGYDPENVDSLSISTDLEDKIRDVVLSANLYDPSITEDETAIADAINDFMRRIKRKQ